MKLAAAMLLGAASADAAPFYPAYSGFAYGVTTVAEETAGGYVAGQTYVFGFNATFGLDIYYIIGSGVVGEYENPMGGIYQTTFQHPEDLQPDPYVFSVVADITVGAPFFGIETPGGKYIASVGGYVEVPSDYANWNTKWHKALQAYGPFPALYPDSTNSDFALKFLNTEGTETEVNFSITSMTIIPEPAPLGLAALGSALFLFQRKRRRG